MTGIAQAAATRHLDNQTIAAGDHHTLVITSSGNLYAWGDNNWGQLGIGTSDQYKISPVQVTAGPTTWKMVAASNYGSAGVGSDSSRTISW